MSRLVWFRRDLRISDNPALFHARQHSRDKVLGLYVITPQQWKEHDEADAKVNFWLANLRSLSAALQRLNIPLLIETCATYAEVPELISGVVQKHGCEELYFNNEYEVNERRRDREVESTCEADDVNVHRFHDRCIVPPTDIETAEGGFYRVFTPYRRVWNERASQTLDVLSRPRTQAESPTAASTVPDSVDGFESSAELSQRWPAGEKEAQRRLKQFLNRISDYESDRDLPAVDGTSTLSPYLAAGVISARRCCLAAWEVGGPPKRGFQGSKEASDDTGVSTWISELTWRDFYMHVLVGFPRVSKHLPFKRDTDQIGWRDDESDLAAWKSGHTGYPIVDAGMRQLNQTGWMHNRLRMVTAMFLTKQLLIDWRLGERYFMRQLIDGDLASNNGGWQWSASTGTDAVPYFRIFNPFSQSKRFDPEGKFIKHYCPELQSIPSAALHDANKLTKAIQEEAVDYSAMIVDHKTGRERALREFKNAG